MYETIIYLGLAYAAVFALRRPDEKPMNAKKAAMVKKPRIPEIENSPDRDAIEALRALGFSKNEAVCAIGGVQAKHGSFDTAELVKAALQQTIAKVV